MDLHTRCVNTIKGLSIDAVQAAGCGHPGLPMGMASAATVLWTKFLKHDPKNPGWQDRDRFVLSAGHGSMLIYSLLHLSGYDLSLGDIKAFRQIGSKTPGHPEYGHTPGVETTTGPLGAGFAMGVGMAIAERLQRERFGADIVNHYTYAVVSDGDLMEGVAHEAASMAGHLGLGKLIYLYDDNQITIDGATGLAFTESTVARFEAMGWQSSSVDGHDPEAVASAIEAAQAETTRPSIICCRTVIGQGSPKFEGTSKVHGAALGADEVAATKANLGMNPDEHFAILDGVKEAFQAHSGEAAHQAWQTRLQNSAHADELMTWLEADSDALINQVEWPTFEPGTKLATRKSSQAALQAIVKRAPWVFGGSADLTGSNGVSVPGPAVQAESFAGCTNIHYGVREHAMGAVCNGMSLHGGLVPYCATFLVFADYMRSSIRLSALMKQPVIYVYSHDSVLLGEDGPTHQPISTLISVRSLPNTTVLRPCDGEEVVNAWKYALSSIDSPTAIILTRQGVPNLDHSADIGRFDQGAYVIDDSDGSPDLVLIGTGSEVGLALAAKAEMSGDNLSIRVVSMPCRELFGAQDDEYQTQILGEDAVCVSIEAGSTMGWHKYVGDSGLAIGVDEFGLSAPMNDIAQALGLTPSAVAQKIREHLGG